MFGGLASAFSLIEKWTSRLSGTAECGFVSQIAEGHEVEAPSVAAHSRIVSTVDIESRQSTSFGKPAGIHLRIHCKYA